MQIGRNEPCPCGSGKKYKRCCLATDEQASRPGQDLHELDHRLFVDMGTWARRRSHAETAGVYDEYPIDFGEREEHLTLFGAWVTYERKIEGRVLADWYLDERGRNLMAHERAWLTAQLASWVSVWEVIEVDPGKTILLRDQLTGAERTVSEISGSQTLSPHLMLLARVVEQEGLSLLVGMHPSPLTPQVGRGTADHIRAELGLAKNATPEKLRAADRPTKLIEIWQDSVEDIENRPLPRLQNTIAKAPFQPRADGPAIPETDRHSVPRPGRRRPRLTSPAVCNSPPITSRPSTSTIHVAKAMASLPSLTLHVKVSFTSNAPVRATWSGKRGFVN